MFDAVQAEEYVPLPKGDVHKKKEIIFARTDPPAKKPVRFSRDRTGDVAKWIPRLPPEQKIPSSNLGILSNFKIFSFNFTFD